MAAHYPGVETDTFVVMPNHIHGIIFLVGAGPRACPNDAGQPQGVAPTMPVPDIIPRFKTLTTKRYTDGVKEEAWTPFAGWLWQRNYYEHIIRNEESLIRIRDYIATNPARWSVDPENHSPHVKIERHMASWRQYDDGGGAACCAPTQRRQNVNRGNFAAQSIPR